MKISSIWYISKYFAPGIDNSIGTRSWFILKEFYKNGINITAITSDSNHLARSPKFNSKIYKKNIEGLDIVWLKTTQFSTAKSISRIISWLSFEYQLFLLNKKNINKPDVIIVSSLSLITIINGILLKYKFGCKLIFEVRDIWPLTIVEEGGVSRWNPMVLLLAFIEYFGYKISDLVVGTMPNLQNHVNSVLGLNHKSKKKVICIPMGYDCEMLHTREVVSKIYLDTYLNKKYFNIVYAGTIGISNALEVFFEAAQLLSRNEKIKFVIIGEGALKAYYVDRFKSFNNIIFPPSVKKSEVHHVLSNANLVYFSTHKSKVWEYGQSLNKIVDYMLSGRPILGSYSGFPSMINEAGCGFFLPADDAFSLASKIEELSLESDQYLDQIGLRGKNWIIANRTYEKISHYYLKELNKLFR